MSGRSVVRIVQFVHFGARVVQVVQLVQVPGTRPHGRVARWESFPQFPVNCVWCPRISVCTTFAGMAMYDLIVIGSGPAGEKGAAQAAYFGKRTAMIEKAAP